MICLKNIIQKWLSFPGAVLLSILIYIHDYLPQYVEIKKWPRFEVPKVQVRENGSA